MKKRVVSFLLVLILVASTLVGCGEKKQQDEIKQSSNSNEDTQQSEETQPNKEQEQLEENNTQSNNTEQTETKKDEGFSIIKQSDSKSWDKENSVKILDELYEEQNIMISPLSLNLALGLLKEGAQGESLDALNNFLGEDFDKFASNYMKNVVSELNMKVEPSDYDSGYNIEFRIANSIWFNKLYKLSKEYSKNVYDKYNATASEFDYEDPFGSADRINGWCMDMTNGLIPTIIEPDQIDIELASVLINSIYFESPWYEPWDFNENAKRFDKFTLFDGTEKTLSLMYSDGDSYYENDYATAFSKSYRNGMKFIGILPKDNKEFTLESLDIPSLLDSKNRDFDELYISMPKLNFETSVKLADMLKTTYLAPMFVNSDSNTDFINMTEIQRTIYVDEIIQKTKLELDENGTRAAAVTAIMMEVTNAMEPVQKEKIIKEVYLERPFAFLIYDEENDQIVFMGKVVNVE